MDFVIVNLLFLFFIKENEIGFRFINNLIL